MNPISIHQPSAEPGEHVKRLAPNLTFNSVTAPGAIPEPGTPSGFAVRQEHRMGLADAKRLLAMLNSWGLQLQLTLRLDWQRTLGVSDLASYTMLRPTMPIDLDLTGNVASVNAAVAGHLWNQGDLVGALRQAHAAEYGQHYAFDSWLAQFPDVSQGIREAVAIRMARQQTLFSW